MAGALDEDTAKTLASGRQTVVSVLGNAQDKLKRIFLVFVAFFMLAFYTMRAFVWDRLKADLVFNRMSGEITRQTDIVVTDPFNVILLQAKIGLAVGILAALPAVVWYGRSGLKRRGFWPSGTVPRWKLGAFGLATVALFAGGVSYAYFVFFPVMFEFLATIAINSGFNPTWSIVMWTDFVFFLSLSFGLAAQLPLAMTAAARTGVVPYETFRDKWRYAVVGIFVFGAFFSPPDPFTQLMWGVPLVALYFISLGVTKLAVLSQRAGQRVSTPAVARERWNLLAGTAVAVGLGVYLFLLEGGLAATNDALSWSGSARRFPVADGLGAFGLAPGVVAGALAAAAGLLAAGLALFYLRIVELERLTGADDAEESEEQSLDLAGMDAAAVKSLDEDRFAAIEENRALAQAQQAVDADRPATARAILDRLDERDADDPEDSPSEAGETAEAGDEGEAENQDSGLLAETTAGIVDPFTEEETTEDDIGGYYYDIAFILDSLTSKAFWVVGVFMLVLAGTFTFLY
ncbi:preprotein translocase subunit TatC, partial [Halobacteriales archaeon QH_10_67_13]